MSELEKALAIIRDKANHDTTKMGKAFERLAKVYLENDALQKQEYSKVWHYSDWAKEQRKGYANADIGIDLVAKLSNGEGYCAIQCKFYQPEHQISKADLDSFISAASTSDFTRLMLIDTSMQALGRNAQITFDNLAQDYQRIQPSKLEDSNIEWLSYIRDGEVRLHPKKDMRDHQIEALNAVCAGLKQAGRGKMIMACGTGKTLTSLRIAEKIAGAGKTVLYMVPSLALMSQTVREWKNDASDDFMAFSACSDIMVGTRKASEDQIEVNLSDLAFPATTNPRQLAEQVKQVDKSKMTVVFSTYHSIDVISNAQYKHGLDAFDLIICDEAHRTTGETLTDEDESNFVKIHDDENVKGKKRLYMTATQKIYGDKAKTKAEEYDLALASMDDDEQYGEELYRLTFSEAVQKDLLTDYKVVILAMDEEQVSYRTQKSLESGSQLILDDVTKMVGCYKALAKIGIDEKLKNNNEPMRQALAFCRKIALSEIFADQFSNVIEEYTANEEVAEEFKTDLEVQVDHVDGTFNAEGRNKKLNWLREDVDGNVCRVLSNVRCLSEGVDVPALDAIMFLHPRNSQIEVVQSVGRVMRKAEGKDLGYVIIPIAVASGVAPEKALNDNRKYRIIWQILNALRAHDERLDGDINKLGLGEDVDRIQVVDGSELDAMTEEVDNIRTTPTTPTQSNADTNLGDTPPEQPAPDEPEQGSFVLELSKAIRAKIVEKCGTRDYWEKWANDIAEIAKAHITRINAILIKQDTPERQAFDAFLDEIRDDLHPEISESDAVEMLAQHIITRPVFDTLFLGNRFTSENAVSKAMETVLARLYDKKVDNESRSLERFYESVKMRAEGVMTADGRQTLIKDLYDRFFRNAFPSMTEKLGIVYTPTEVVDFIIHSVNDVLRDEFDKSLGNKNVDILDPFTGTGTFITRLMHSGIISNKQLPHKYKNEIHANEMVLLAYYVACINIEAVYADIMKEEQYQPFNGIVLTDTFHLFEQERDMIDDLMPDNSQRRTAQKERDITVIVGNPPYSMGQKSENDNAANVSYPNLDREIAETYAKSSNAIRQAALYDSYIRAFRWASDRLGDEGVIGFVTNAGWVDANATDGLRKCLQKEFSTIYVFHLRGNQRTSGEISRKEGGKIFGAGSRAPIAISILVKNKNADEQGKIYYHDIGDYLDRNQKLAIISSFRSIEGIKRANKFHEIIPDEESNWINQGDKAFKKFIAIGDKASKSKAIFSNYSNGIVTSRDAWCYNFSTKSIENNIGKTIQTFNQNCDALPDNLDNKQIKEQATKDTKEISWSRALFSRLEKKKKLEFDDNKIRQSIYRPFQKMHLYYDNALNEVRYQNDKIFPKPKTQNKVICISGTGSKNGFSTFMTDCILDFQFMFNGQCFPLHIFEKPEADKGLLKEEVDENGYKIIDGISDKGFQHFRDAYPNKKFTKEDLFYYIYGLLHAPEYRERFQNNLTKELPRIPAVKTFDDFMAFAKAGRELGALHVNYENVEPYQISIKEGDLRLAHIPNPKEFFRVTKMKFPNKNDKSKLRYNKNITIQDIPLEAYDYVVNGKPALEWVMERQCVKTDTASGITNDANDYANETMNDPEYPLKLFQRVITVSLETMKIVKSMPKLDIK